LLRDIDQNLKEMNARTPAKQQSNLSGKSNNSGNKELDFEIEDYCLNM